MRRLNKKFLLGLLLVATLVFAGEIIGEGFIYGPGDPGAIGDEVSDVLSGFAAGFINIGDSVIIRNINFGGLAEWTFIGPDGFGGDLWDGPGGTAVVPGDDCDVGFLCEDRINP